MRDVAYTPTPGGWAAYLAGELDAEPAIGRAERRLFAAALVRAILPLPLWLLVCWGFLAASNPDFTTFSLLLGVLLWVLCAIPIVQRGRGQMSLSHHRRRFLRQDTPAEAPVAGRKFKVTLSETGVGIAEARSSAGLSWPLFTRVIARPGCVVLERDDLWSSVVIPTAEFDSPAHAAAFAVEAAALHDASGAGEQAQLSTRFAEAGVPCPDCGYSLGGLTGARCPECGRTMTAMTLRCIDVLREPFWRLIARGYR